MRNYQPERIRHIHRWFRAVTQAPGSASTRPGWPGACRIAKTDRDTPPYPGAFSNLGSPPLPQEVHQQADRTGHTMLQLVMQVERAVGMPPGAEFSG